jgi:hypothetical protein
VSAVADRAAGTAVDGAVGAVAFGLDLNGELPQDVRFHQAPHGAGHAVRLMRSDALGAAESCEGDDEGLRIEPVPDGAHRISAPGCGVCVVTADGSTIAYAPGREDSLWRRLLLEQALPFAACAAGRECLHASAVTLAGQAVAVAGVSGSGKSSLAAQLTLRGATPIADDVLALEPIADGGLLAHPALPRMGLRNAEAERIGTAAVAALGDVGPRDEDSVAIALDASAGPAPLGALYLLDRRPDPGQLALAPVEDPRLVLATSFNFVLAAPKRLARLLDLCHRLERHVHLQRAIVPADVDASALADAIAADVAGRW